MGLFYERELEARIWELEIAALERERTLLDHAIDNKRLALHIWELENAAADARAAAEQRQNIAIQQQEDAIAVATMPNTAAAHAATPPAPPPDTVSRPKQHHRPPPPLTKDQRQQYLPAKLIPEYSLADVSDWKERVDVILMYFQDYPTASDSAIANKLKLDPRIIHYMRSGERYPSDVTHQYNDYVEQAAAAARNRRQHQDATNGQRGGAFPDMYLVEKSGVVEPVAQAMLS